MFSTMKSRFQWKGYMKHSGLAVLLFTASLNFNGCILDAFDTLTQELPYTIDVNINTTDTSHEESTTFNLNDSEFYNNNKDKINHIKLLKIAYKTNSVSPQSLTGTITLTVKQSNGVILFSKIIPGNQPSAYTTNPYELSLSQSEIQLVNSYLSILTNRVFTATVKVETATTGTKTLNAQVFAVFDMDYDL